MKFNKTALITALFFSVTSVLPTAAYAGLYDKSDKELIMCNIYMYMFKDTNYDKSVYKESDALEHIYFYLSALYERKGYPPELGILEEQYKAAAEHDLKTDPGLFKGMVKLCYDKF